MIQISDENTSLLVLANMMYSVNNYSMYVYDFSCEIDEIRNISGDMIAFNFDSMTEVIPTINSEYFHYHDQEKLKYTIIKIHLKEFQHNLSSFMVFCLMLYAIVAIIFSIIVAFIPDNRPPKSYKLTIFWFELRLAYTLFIISCICRYF